MEYFKDKITIVTGGASGMGRAVCEQMGRHGATLVVADIHHDGAREVAESIVAAGGQARAVHLDVTRREEIEEKLPHWLYMDQDRAGTAILKGVARNRAMIVFPFHARLAWWLMRLCPPLFDRIGRVQIRAFRKNYLTR